MAGLSTSSSSFSYDVFLNFRGQDTFLGFTGNLYNALKESGIRTFIEDGKKIQRGDHMASTTLKAIEESMIAIPVFSQDYASSLFCLDELVKISECMKEKHMIVLPIFYQVDPSHVRHQTGSYGKALAIHEEKFKDSMDKVQKWRMALNLVADMSGWIYRNESGYQYEYEFIKEIVKEVSSKIIISLPRVSKYPVEYENDFIGKITEEISNKINGGTPLHDESQLLEISLLLNEFDVKVHKTSKKVLEAQVRVWRLIGLVTSVVGLLCYALSPSFTRLIRGWNPLKILLYGVLAFAIWIVILFAKQRPFSWQGKLTAFFGFVVFMLTNVYSFYFDKAMTNETPDVLSMVSNGAFAFTSLSFSKVFKFGFDLGIFSCFLTLLAAQLMTIHFMLIFVAIIFGIPLFIMHSSSDFRPEADSSEHHAIDIDPLNR